MMFSSRQKIAGTLIIIAIDIIFFGMSFVENLIPSSISALPPREKTMIQVAPCSRSTKSDATSKISASPPSRRPRLGVEVCGSRSFVEWYDEEAGIIRLVPEVRKKKTSNSSGDDLLVSPLCPADQVVFRCEDHLAKLREQYEELSNPLPPALSFVEARRLALGVFDDDVNASLSETAFYSQWTTEPNDDREFYQIDRHLADQSDGAKPCMSFAFNCRSKKMCHPSLPPKLCASSAVRYNSLLRFPHSNQAREMFSQSSPVWEAKKRRRVKRKKASQVRSNSSPNVLILAIDSLSAVDFENRFHETKKFLEKMRRISLFSSPSSPQEVPAERNERVVEVKDATSVGPGTHFNQPPVVLGKMPLKCLRIHDPHIADGDAELQLRGQYGATLQSSYQDTLQSSLFKVAKDNGYLLSTSFRPDVLEVRENACQGVSREAHMTGGIPLRSGKSTNPVSAIRDPNPRRGIKTPAADLYQWSWFRSSIRGSALLGGSSGCIAQQHEMDFVTKYVESKLLSGDIAGGGLNSRVNFVPTSSSCETRQKSPAGPVFGYAQINTAHQRNWGGGAIELLDRKIAELLEKLFRNGALEDTVVALWSDHGVALTNDEKRTGTIIRELSHPNLFFLVPPSVSLLKNSNSSSEQEKSDYFAAIDRLGRRRISDSSRKMLVNMLTNGNELNMRTTAYDVYATLVHLLARSNEKDYDGEDQKGREPLLHNGDGVVPFARSMTHDYKRDPTSNRHAWIFGESFYQTSGLDKLYEAGNLTRAQVLERIMRPPCSQIGIIPRFCRHVGRVRPARLEPEAEVQLKEELKIALTKKITTLGKAPTVVPMCTPWSNVSLNTFNITSVEEQGSTTEGLNFHTLIYSVQFEVNMTSSWSGHRLLRFLASTVETTARSMLTNPEPVALLPSFSGGMKIGSLKRMTTYEEDQDRCGKETLEFVNMKEVEGTGGEKKISWDGIEHCMCL